MGAETPPRSSLGCAPSRKLAGQQTKSKNHVGKKPHAGEFARGSMRRPLGRRWTRSRPQLEKVPAPEFVRRGAKPARGWGAPLQRAGCVTILHAIMMSIAGLRKGRPESHPLAASFHGAHDGIAGGQRRGRRCPKPMPRIPAFCRSAASVRFILFAITVSGVRAFECAWSCRTSCIVQGMR